MSHKDPLLEGSAGVPTKGLSTKEDKSEAVTAMLDDKTTFYVPDDPSNYPEEDQY